MDIWISLNGTDEAGRGTIDAPYRTLKFAYTHSLGANKFILSNSGGSPTSEYVEEELVFNNERGITIYAEEFGSVFIKTPRIVAVGSEITFVGVVIKPTVNSSSELVLTQGSVINFIDSRLQDIQNIGINSSGSRLNFTNLEIHGAASNAILCAMESNSYLRGVGKVEFSGTYSIGLTAYGCPSLSVENMLFTGAFSRAAVIDALDISNPALLLNNVTIDSRYDAPFPSGIFINNVRNEYSINSIHRFLAYRLQTALQITNSDLEIDKVTIDSCSIAIHALDGTNILLSNASLTNNDLALKSETSSNIEYRYTNFYNNTMDFESQYIDLFPPEEFNLFLSYPNGYELMSNDIKVGSERVTSVETGQKFVRNVDYIIEYGNEAQLGKIYRVANGDIPNGMRVSVTYKYRNLNEITGTTTPGPRIRHADPRYVSIAERDYRLADDSPLIDSGVFTGRDFLGTAPDIGAFERTRPLSLPETIVDLNIKAENSAVTIEPDVENTIKLQIDNLSAYEPNLDVSEGSVVRDLIIKPAGHLLDQPKVTAAYLMRQQSILNYASMTESELDLLAGNYFITRRPGVRATGTVRMYFSRPTDALIPVGTVFTTGGGLEFLTVRDQAITADEMVFNVDVDRYFFDVSIQAAAEGEKYIVGPNSIRSVKNFNHVYLTEITNISETENGLSSETNAQLYERLKNAWSIRALVSRRSIDTVLKEAFPGIRSLTVVGARDPYMNRDIIKELRHYIGNYHTYGRVDLYVLPYDHQFVSQIYTMDGSATIRIDAKTVHRPVIYISALEILDINDVPIKKLDESEYEIVVDDEDYRFSSVETFTIKIKNVDDYAFQSVKVTYLTAKIIREIQEYVDSDEVRNVCTDILVKHYVPKVMNMNITYQTNSTDNIEPEMFANITEAVSAHPAGEDFYLSSLSTPILFSGATAFVTPLSVIVKTWHQTGATTIQAVEDVISVSRIEHPLIGDVTFNKLE